MDHMMMQLNYRATVFSELISNTVCTSASRKVIDLEVGMSELMERLRQLRVQKNTLYIIGNGGSATVASHALVDFINVAKISARVLHEFSLVTCMANDFGYEFVYSRVLVQCLKQNDILIAISSSGNSPNICNAVNVARECRAQIITLTGFSENNKVRQLGDINFWLDSCDYGYVEVGHQFILHNLSDRFQVEDKQQTLSQDECSIL